MRTDTVQNALVQFVRLWRAKQLFVLEHDNPAILGYNPLVLRIPSHNFGNLYSNISGGNSLPTETITAFERFLAWGPIGLAGLMLVLVIFAMVTSELTKLKAILLSFFMVVGAACFGAALYFDSIDNGGEHNLVLSVLPNDIVESGFPPPSIRINGQLIDREEEAMVIKGTTILQVDVNRAIVALREADEKIEMVVAEASEVRQDLEIVSTTARTLEREVSLKEVELADATQTIRQQQAALEVAQETGGVLATRIQSLQAQISSLDRNTLAPVERDLSVIERQLLQFNNQLVLPTQP
jgi:hypothetical protein